MYLFVYMRVFYSSLLKFVNEKGNLVLSDSVPSAKRERSGIMMQR